MKLSIMNNVTSKPLYIDSFDFDVFAASILLLLQYYGRHSTFQIKGLLFFYPSTKDFFLRV